MTEQAKHTAEYPLEVVRDCGFGRCWSRLASDQADAERVMAEWQIEGLSPRDRAAGLFNGGEFRIQPSHEARAAIAKAEGRS